MLRTSISMLLLCLACVNGAAILEKQCLMKADTKVDCGYSSITRKECLSRHCCWQEIGPNPSNTPWCYYHTSLSNESHFIIPNTTITPPFSDNEVASMCSYFMNNMNIDGQGGVVASPDEDTPGGSYDYAWERDGALSMNAFINIADNFDISNATLQMYMKSYVKWVLGRQIEADPHQQDVRVEPKYILPNGEVFPGEWCRPQTDGPGLRAITLTHYANRLMAAGKANWDYVSNYLWTNNDLYNGGAIYYDLEWVVDNWESEGCDLWEEIRSNDIFWNRMIFRRALLDGAALSTKMGNLTTAVKYRKAANTIGSTLTAHFNGEFVFEASSRLKDAAVITAFNDGYTEDGMFSPVSKEVAGTVKTLNELFGSFPINMKDNDLQIPGILYGRYDGDTYANGNPWVLTTGALAHLFYRGAAATIESNSLPGADALAVWAKVFGKPKFASVTEFSKTLFAAGDAVLLRLRHHVKSDNFHLSEQIDKMNGNQMAAHDLTWSYGTVLKALNERKNIINKL